MAIVETVQDYQNGTNLIFIKKYFIILQFI